MSTYVISDGFNAASNEIEPIMTSTKYLDEQYTILNDLMNTLHEYELINEKEDEQLDALLTWIGEINKRLPEEGVIIIEMSE